MAAAPVSHGGGFAALVSKLGGGFSAPMTPKEDYKQRILAINKQYKVQARYIDKVHRGMDKADTDPRKFYEIVCKNHGVTPVPAATGFLGATGELGAVGGGLGATGGLGAVGVTGFPVKPFWLKESGK